MAAISQAVRCAVDTHPEIQGRHFQDISFKSIRVGIAGYDRPALAPLINKALRELFSRSLSGGNLTVTSDIDLLTAGVENKKNIENVIILNAGTGSIAMSYKRGESGGRLRRTGRVGGWGYLLGDDGAGYGIAREAIRRALRYHEMRQLLGSATSDHKRAARLYQAVIEHFQSRSSGPPSSKSTGDLLGSILAEEFRASPANHVASVAPVILGLAHDDAECQSIIDMAIASLLEIVEVLVKSQSMDLTNTALVLGGGLMRDDSYRGRILDAIEAKLGRVAHIEVITEPATTVVQHLLLTLPHSTREIRGLI